MPNPVYKVKHRLDSRAFEELTIAEFLHAETVTLVETASADPANQRTEVKVMWDSQSLLVCFEMEDIEPTSPYQNHDDPLYESNVAEMFIDPLGGGRVYYELQVNPNNASFDSLVCNNIRKAGRRGDKFFGFTDWNPASFRHKSIIKNGSWTVIFSIDFDDLFLARHVPPKSGEVWRANFFRIDQTGGETQYCAWSPTGVVDFHNTKAFGHLIFEA